MVPVADGDSSAILYQLMPLDLPDPQRLKRLLEDWLGKKAGHYAYRIVVSLVVPLSITAGLLFLIVSIHNDWARITAWFSSPIEQPSTSPGLAVPSSPAPAPVRPTQSTGAKRVFTDWTVINLRAPFKDHTVMQATELIAGQIGKWINVDGRLSAVPVSMVFWISSNSELVQCVFNDAWKTRLMAYRINDPIRVVGKVNDTQVGDRLALTDCELR